MSAPGLVVGYEGGGPGKDAIAFAGRWCQSSGDSLLVVTVHPGAAPTGAGRVDAEWVAYERDEADRLLAEAKALVPADVDADFVRVDAASAAHGLHELAEQTDEHRLVVLGTRRSGESARTYPGSTAERLFSGAGGPVALVPRDYETTAEHPLRRVTAAYVDTADGRVALDHAGQIAQHLSASLDVVTVVPDTRVSPAMGEPHRFAEGQRADYRSSLELAVAGLDPALEPSARLLEGPIAETLAGIGPHDTDVLVSGSRGYGPIRRVLLGGVSSRLVRRAQVPVIVVPRGER